MKKKKSFDPFDFTMKHGALTIGTIGTVGMAGRLSQQMPSSQSASIMGGMNTITVLPTIHAASGVFGSLGMLEDVVKKKRR